MIIILEKKCLLVLGFFQNVLILLRKYPFVDSDTIKYMYIDTSYRYTPSCSNKDKLSSGLSGFKREIAAIFIITSMKYS